MKIPAKAGTLPRGIRNNNPGNIDRSPHTVWQGQATKQSDPRFIVFTDMFYGVRALAKVLLTYQGEYGLKTVSQLIDRWAPPVENKTAVYVADVASDMMVNPNEPIDLHQLDKLTAMVRAISRHENGGDYLSSVDVAKGCSLAIV